MKINGDTAQETQKKFNRISKIKGQRENDSPMTPLSYLHETGIVRLAQQSIMYVIKPGIQSSFPTVTLF